VDDPGSLRVTVDCQPGRIIGYALQISRARAGAHFEYTLDSHEMCNNFKGYEKIALATNE